MQDTLSAYVYNQAIEDALKEYNRGRGAIAALKKQFIVTVEHEGRSTKQEVRVSE